MEKMGNGKGKGKEWKERGKAKKNYKGSKREKGHRKAQMKKEITVYGK